MTGVNLETKFVTVLGGGDEADQFVGIPGRRAVGEGSGVQFNHLGSKLGGGGDLRDIRIDEETDLRSGVLQLLNRGAKGVQVGDDIEAAFRGDLLAILGHQAAEIWLHFTGHGDDFRSGSKLKIQVNADRFAQGENVAILNVAAVFAEVDGDGVGACGFAFLGSREDIRLGIVSVEHGGVSRLAKGGHVIDVDAEFESTAHD